MALENYLGSDRQPQNLFFGDKSSELSNRDPSVTEGSSGQGPVLDFSPHSVAQMPEQNARHIPGSVNVKNNLTDLAASFNGGSIITGVASSQGHGFSCADSPASISGFSAADQLPSRHDPQISQTAHTDSVPRMSMLDNPRLVTTEKESLIPNKPPLWQATKSKPYNDCVVASGMLHQGQNPSLEQQNPHQQQQNPCQQQQNPCQQQQNPHQQQQNPCQQQQSPHQQLLNPAVQPQQAADAGVNDGDAVKRLMSYLHDRRNRPPDNSIVYWRSFVNHYFSPRVKKTTCFSKYAHSGGHAHYDFTQGTWKCGICGSTPGNGIEFVDTFDVLPRMNQLYFNSSGVIDELMYIGLPTERRLPRGLLAVCCETAVRQSIYEHCRVVHKGKLRVIFTPQLQIISWNFCVEQHEVYTTHRRIASQVNDFISAATINDDAEGQNLPSNVNRVVGAGSELAAALEQPRVTDLGLSNHYVRSLQVSGVLNAMKDLMDSSLNNNTGPIETLKQFSGKSAEAKLVTGQKDSRPPMIPRPTPGPHNNAQRSFGPSSARISPGIEKMMINDLLAHIQGEETKRARSEDTMQNLQGGMQKRSRVDSSQVNNELVTGHTLNGSSSSPDQTRGLLKKSDRPQEV